MDELSAIEHKISMLKAELSQLEAKRLKLISARDTELPVGNASLSPEQKIQLFQSYFNGNSSCVYCPYCGEKLSDSTPEVSFRQHDFSKW